MSDKPFQPSSGATLGLAQVTTLNETITARYQYADMLHHTAALVASGKLPDQNPATSTQQLLRCIHVALAAEVYKSTEILAAMCEFVGKHPAQQFMRIINVTQTAASAFYDNVPTSPTDDDVRPWLPMLHPNGPGLTPLEQEAILLNDRAVCGMLRNSILMAKEAHRFLRKFRNRFSHAYGLILGGDALHDDEGLAIFSLARKQENKPDRKLGWLDGMLVYTPDTNSTLLRMLQVFLETEAMILRFRGSAFVHGEPALIPHFYVNKAAKVAVPRMAEAFESAFQKLGCVAVKATVKFNFEVVPQHQAAAQAFYRLLQDSPFTENRQSRDIQRKT